MFDCSWDVWMGSCWVEMPSSTTFSWATLDIVAFNFYVELLCSSIWYFSIDTDA